MNSNQSVYQFVNDNNKYEQYIFVNAKLEISILVYLFIVYLPKPSNSCRGMNEIGITDGPQSSSKDTTVPMDTGSEGVGGGSPESRDLYLMYKQLQKQLQFLQVQEDYIKDEQKNLKREFRRAQEEVKRIQSVPLIIGQFLEAVDSDTGIVGSTTGPNCYVRILSTIDRELLKPNASVALHRHSNSVVDVLPPEADSSIAMLESDEKPDVSYADIGGLDIQKQEMREAVELPLTQHELYQQIGEYANPYIQ